MIFHFQINGQPRNNLRGCTTGVKSNEIKNLFLQATKPSCLLCSLSHTIYLSREVYEEQYGEPRGSLGKTAYCNGSMTFHRGSANFLALGPL